MRSIVTVVALLIVTSSAQAASTDGASLTGVDAKIWNGLPRTTWIAQGEGDRVIYAFVDPNCPYSRDLFRKAHQLLNPASVQIRWVPVGVLPKGTEDSRYKAAAAVNGGSKTLELVMRGSAPDVKPSHVEFGKVDGSADFLAHEIGKYVQAGVPKVIYVKESGNEIRVFTGVPQQTELTKMLR